MLTMRKWSQNLTLTTKKLFYDNSPRIGTNFKRNTPQPSVHRMLKVFLLLLLLLLLLLRQEFPPHYQPVGTPNTSLSHSPLPTATFQLPAANCHLPTARKKIPPTFFCQKFFPPQMFSVRNFSRQKNTILGPKSPTVAAEGCSHLQELEKSCP